MKDHDYVRRMREKYGHGRQYGRSLDDIKANHVARYQWAVERLPDDADVLDLASGCGYGSWILAHKARSVLGVELHPGVVVEATATAAHEDLTFLRGDFHNAPVHCRWDVIVAFEIVEHVIRPEIGLARLRRHNYGNRLLISTPNGDVTPHCAAANPFHVKHYGVQEFLDLLNSSGWDVQDCHHQNYGEVGEVETDGKVVVVEAVGTRQIDSDRIREAEAAFAGECHRAILERAEGWKVAQERNAQRL